MKKMNELVSSKSKLMNDSQELTLILYKLKTISSLSSIEHDDLTYIRDIPGNLRGLHRSRVVSSSILLHCSIHSHISLLPSPIPRLLKPPPLPPATATPFFAKISACVCPRAWAPSGSHSFPS